VSRVGIVTGMVAESGCLSDALSKAAPDARPLLYCAAASTERAYAGARALVEQGATALVSFGIAGGLAPDLPPGALVLAEAVLDASGRRWTTATAWRLSLQDETGADASGPLLASETAIRTAAEKSELQARTGAIAVDMESGGVARAAEAAGVPFLVVRVVADPASRRLPPSALAGLGPDGRQRPRAVLAALTRRPWDIVELIRLGRDSSTALRRLRRVASRGPSVFLVPGA
jgi:adenosylhomocysteine nucleosidase